MREAEFRSVVRALERRSGAEIPSISRIAVSGLPGVEDFDLAPGVGFLAICGGTGMGKTALMDLLFAALCPLGDGELTPDKPRLGAATVKVDIEAGGVISRFERAIGMPQVGDTDGLGAGITFVGLAQRTAELQIFFQINDAGSLKEGLESYDLEEEYLEVLSMACGKRFRAVRITEIEDDEYKIFPYFEIEADGARYSTQSAATGELSALYLAFALRSASVGSLILIEEPEAFLPPAAHRPIFGLIAKVATKKKAGVVVTTHAPGIAEHVPSRSLISLRRHGNLTVPAKQAETKVKTLSRLGLKAARRAVLVVEDAVARLVLQNILARTDMSLTCDIEVVVGNDGAGSIRKLIQYLPSDIDSVQILGVLDGDMRAEAALWRPPVQVAFLPFTASMEEEILAALGANMSLASATLIRPEADIEDALQESRGLDHHDRLHDVARRLHVSVEVLVTAGLERWSKVVANKANVREFVKRLAQDLGVEVPALTWG